MPLMLASTASSSTSDSSAPGVQRAQTAQQRHLNVVERIDVGVAPLNRKLHERDVVEQVFLPHDPADVLAGALVLVLHLQ